MSAANSPRTDTPYACYCWDCGVPFDSPEPRANRCPDCLRRMAIRYVVSRRQPDEPAAT